MSDCQCRLLANFKRSIIYLYISLAGLIGHVIYSYIFVIKLDLGIYGTGIAFVCS